MYDWLPEALQGEGLVVTASRRLARELAAENGRRRTAAGETAWPTPPIHALPDWLDRTIADSRPRADVPARLSGHHERVLWERCLAREIDDVSLNPGPFLHQARDAWRRLQEYRVPLPACRKSAVSHAQRIFAAAAAAYASILTREGWVDDAGLIDVVRALPRAAGTAAAARITLAGFDCVTPQLQALIDTLDDAGTAIEIAPRPPSAAPSLLRSDTPDSELRSVGAWARRQLDRSPDLQVAVVVAGLEQDARRKARLIREGLVPGWQTGGPRHRGAVNLSIGQALSDYPICATALGMLGWLSAPADSKAISRLLLSAHFGAGDLAARSRIERRLRGRPDRAWRCGMFVREFAGQTTADDESGWLLRLSRLDRQAGDWPPRQSAVAWARAFDSALALANWPGHDGLDSTGFQIVNRWRELLNEFAALDIVCPSLTAAEALARLRTMAADTVFQPETDTPLVQLLAPREAAGMEFDRLWIAGLTATAWPPPRRPSALLSRALQRDHGMPDADPATSLAAARRVLDDVLAAAQDVRCSYPGMDGEAEELPTGLLADADAAASDDPGWHARSLVRRTHTVACSTDPVPPLGKGESVPGGASVIQWQVDEPFAAFVHARLGVRGLPPIRSGLGYDLRGRLLHDALHQLYRDRPSQAEIAGWRDAALAARCRDASAAAIGRHVRNADAVLRAVLDLEARRVAGLLPAVVALDATRSPFRIEAVEGSVAARIAGVPLQLRFDRIDRRDDGRLVIIDYKTGQTKKLLDADGNLKSVQLVVYAAAVDGSVGGLALLNVDSREVAMYGAGDELTPDDDWERTLARWIAGVEDAAAAFRRGDVRLADRLVSAETRPLSILSRIAELARVD